jgi:ribonuclease E
MVDEHAQDAADAAAAQQDTAGDESVAGHPEEQLALTAPGAPTGPEGDEQPAEPEGSEQAPADDEPAGDAPDDEPAVTTPAPELAQRRRRAASRPAGPPAHQAVEAPEPPSVTAPATAPAGAEDDTPADEQQPEAEPTGLPAQAPTGALGSPTAPSAEATTGRRPRRATRGVTSVAFSHPSNEPAVVSTPPAEVPAVALFQPPDEARAVSARRRSRPAEARAGERTEVTEGTEVVEDQPGPEGHADIEPAPERATRRRRSQARDVEAEPADQVEPDELDEPTDSTDLTEDDDTDDADDDGTGPRRRRRRGGRRRRRGQAGEPTGDTDAESGRARADAGSAAGDDTAGSDQAETDADAEAEEASDGEGGGSRRRRRRRRRAGVAEEMEDLSTDDTATVVKVRESRRTAADEITSVRGSTRIEAKRQRRRDGREAGRRRAPILTEAEFLARRESVNRVMCVREHGDRVQIAVLEDGVLVEHYVNRADSSSMLGNVYLGKVQNVLPSMEAAFVDVGRGRNAVLYAGEVNWEAAGLEGQPKRIELALKSGDPVLVQVTKDPMGHKGARLTSQISLPGRFLVYVPEGSMTGISRKLPDTERARLKGVLKDIVPDGAGVIVRTAAEGATEEQLAADVRRLTEQWAEIQRKAKSASPPSLLYGEPDLVIKVVRDIFNEDFTSLVVQGESTWRTLHDYVSWVAPDLLPKISAWTGTGELYAEHRIDEQLAKALDRKVWLPSGGSLVIDRTEAMTVIDVNTGKFTGQGGNLEETVTRNNLEAAEEIVRQLRLRDIGGIIVVDFIDMVLESNRDLVLRRLVECLGRDRTKHQVAEVTSLGLVQMTRKRIGQGLLEVFSTPCEHCGGRGHVVHTDPVGDDREDEGSGPRRDRDRGGRRGRSAATVPVHLGGKQTGKVPPPPKFDDHAHPEHADEGGETSPGDGSDVPADVGPDVLANVLDDAPLADAPVEAEAVEVPADPQAVGSPVEPEAADSPADPEAVDSAVEPEAAEAPAEPAEDPHQHDDRQVGEQVAEEALPPGAV